MRGRGICHRLTLVVLSLLLGLTACSDDESTPDSQAPSTEGGVTLSLHHVSDLTVEVTVTNSTDAAVTVVRPFVTPIFVRFHVTGPDGNTIPFDGPNLRLEPLIDSDFAALAPGESVSSRYDLADHFTVPSGSITVAARYVAREAHHDGRALTIDLDAPLVAEPITIEVP